MQLDSDRRFRVPVRPDALWSAIARTDDYRRWWPWLTAFEADGLVAGGVWRCAIRPPLPYTLCPAIHIDEGLLAALVTVRVTGDVAGIVGLDVTPHDQGCDDRLRSRLAPHSRAFRKIATVARPLVRRGHEWVLDTGASEFVGHAVDQR